MRLSGRLAGLSPGDVLRGTVLADDGEGRAVLQTAQGRFAVDPVSALPAKGDVEIVITQVRPDPSGVLVSREGQAVDPPQAVRLTLVAAPPSAAQPITAPAPAPALSSAGGPAEPVAGRPAPAPDSAPAAQAQQPTLRALDPARLPAAAAAALGVPDAGSSPAALVGVAGSRLALTNVTQPLQPVATGSPPTGQTAQTTAPPVHPAAVASASTPTVNRIEGVPRLSEAAQSAWLAAPPLRLAIAAPPLPTADIANPAKPVHYRAVSVVAILPSGEDSAQAGALLTPQARSPVAALRASGQMLVATVTAPVTSDQSLVPPSAQATAQTLLSISTLTVSLSDSGQNAQLALPSLPAAATVAASAPGAPGPAPDARLNGLPPLPEGTRLVLLVTQAPQASGPKPDSAQRGVQTERAVTINSGETRPTPSAAPQTSPFPPAKSQVTDLAAPSGPAPQATPVPLAVPAAGWIAGQSAADLPSGHLQSERGPSAESEVAARAFTAQTSMAPAPAHAGASPSSPTGSAPAVALLLQLLTGRGWSIRSIASDASNAVRDRSVAERLTGERSAEPARMSVTLSPPPAANPQQESPVPPLTLWWSEPRQKGGGEDSAGAQEAAEGLFALDVDFAGLGATRLTGLLDGRHLTVNLSSAGQWPDSLRQSTRQVLAETLRETGLTGHLTFARS